MNEPVPHGLREWAALPGPARVLDTVRRRAHRGGSLDRGTLSVTLTTEERQQVGRLLGARWEVSRRPVTLHAFASGLAGHGLTVRRFVEALDGTPLIDRREIREAEHHAARQERMRVLEILDAAGVPTEVTQRWLADRSIPNPGTGRTAELAERVAAVWARLPWAGQPWRLAQLAATVTHDAHALDYDTELGRAVARLVAAQTGIARPARPGREWRAVWSAAGVRCDTVSSRVLTLNLPLDITAGHRRGVPAWLTLRDLLGPWHFEPSPQRIYVCENPTVVEAAADELGRHCAPLICTDGVPALAALDLIAGADDAGIELRVRADIDAAGFVIVDTVRTAAPRAEPWRFDVATYTGYFGAGEGDSLIEVYRSCGRDLHEESVLGELLGDLAGTAADIAGRIGTWSGTAK
ncbi:TIGR02679 domain-containing protein [Nocardia sp. alder85J]|uniref:TIGR02679 domain-containing protein n=1 Tax=Nocardia sp. alder85J TaxID=2862949 RepID=UPI001CD7148B|nr:TIGR02679 domain-containing protein [Nocardia sp. alder85J]MCX4095314.1 TIGR02679 domain-containing protein [Nocardia sp. alder85J]